MKKNIPSYDTRSFWIKALLNLPTLKDKHEKILELTSATETRLYPGYVLEKLYYTGSFPKLAPYIDDLFTLAHGSIDIGYKPESILYWLRICVESEKILEKEMSKVIELGKIAQKKNLKPEFIYYELWGFTNLDYLTSDHLSSIIDIMQHAMETNLDPYDVFHWLRVNLHIHHESNKDISKLINKVLERINNKNEPIDFLVKLQEKHFEENPSHVTKVASSIEFTHIVGRAYSKKK